MSSYSVLSFKGSHLPEQYTGLVYSKWLYSFRYGNKYFRRIDAKSYFSSYNSYISKLLADPEAIVRIAALSDDHDVALGFSVTNGSILHYVYVHRDYRGKGIGKSLVPASTSTITHMTDMVVPICKTKYSGLVFNPFV